MKNKAQIYVLLSLIFLLCPLTIKSESKPVKGQKLYSWIDKTRVRKIPNLKAKAIGYLDQGEDVVFLGLISKKKVGITLRTVYFETPFYKIKRKNGMIGWVYAGALINEKVLSDKEKQELKKKFDKIIIKIDKMKRFIPKKENKEYTTLKIGIILKDKGQLIYYKDMGHTPVGNQNAYQYFKNGFVSKCRYDQCELYYFGNFITRRGIKSGLSIKKIKQILGRPYRENNTVLSYASTNHYGAMEEKYLLYFKNNKLLYIYTSFILGD